MLRAMIPIVLVLILNLSSGSHDAMAFTVRFGPVAVVEDATATHDMTDADIPSPRMLNVVVGSDGMTFGPTSTAPEVTPIVPAVRARDEVPPPVADEPPASLADRITSPRQLRGAEIMLLRRAAHVAER